MYSCCNRKAPGIFAGYQAFWIIVVIAVVIIWVHYGVGCNGGGWGSNIGNNNNGCCCNNDPCGCNDGCYNPCC